MRIYLIGMPGSGKTTIGRLLSEKLKYKFVDLDALIEEKAMSFVDHIFEMYGEEHFRLLETECLANIKGDNLVISTGGGVVLKKDNKRLMDGIIVYLFTPVKVIENRLKGDYSRPLLKTKSIEALYDERFLKYQNFADIIISNQQSVNDTVNDIISELIKKELI